VHILRAVMPGLVEPGTIVLIVDDEVVVREAIAETLIMEGYDARPVPSADVALAQLASGVRPALVILDLWLPGVGSRGVIRGLRTSANASVPILIVSAAASLDHTELDADAVLRKPFDMTTLVRAVDKLTGLGRQGGASAPRRRPPQPAPSARHHVNRRRLRAPRE
jgi:DNA-binding response OmpR family regulator